MHALILITLLLWIIVILFGTQNHTRDTNFSMQLHFHKQLLTNMSYYENTHFEGILPLVI